jgi:hypothetical protein
MMIKACCSSFYIGITMISKRGRGDLFTPLPPATRFFSFCSVFHSKRLFISALASDSVPVECKMANLRCAQSIVSSSLLDEEDFNSCHLTRLLLRSGHRPPPPHTTHKPPALFFCSYYYYDYDRREKMGAGFYPADCCFALIISAERKSTKRIEKSQTESLAAVVHKSGKSIHFI